MSQDAHGPDGNSNGDRRNRRIGRRRADARGADAASERAALQAELVLLREENARLKAAEHEPPSFGRLLSRARALPGAQIANEEYADEAAQAVIDVVVLRESLLEVCAELEHAMGAVRTRLGAIAPVGDEHLDVLVPRSHGSQVVADEMLREGLNGGNGNA